MPIHIFEERYKRMIQECLDSTSDFGVALIETGSEVGEPAVPCSTGTLVDIVEVNKVNGGRMFISVKGRQCFQIKEIVQYRPYIKAKVELLRDESEVVSPEEMEILGQAVTAYLRLIVGIQGGWIRGIELTSQSVGLSYMIGGLLQIELLDKQSLLEQPSGLKRLEAELDILEKEIRSLKERADARMRQKFGRN